MTENGEGADAEKETKMTFQEKIDFIDHEIRMLHNFCKQTGYSAEKINEFAQPFLVEITNEKRRNNQRRILIVAFSVLLFSFICYGVLSQPLGQAVIRLAALRFFPLYEWIHIHKDECLIRNPLYLDQYMTEEDCEMCESIDRIARLTDLTEETFVEQFLKTGAHVIVKNGMKDWPKSMKSLNIKTFKHFYKSEPAFQEYEACDYSSNLPYGTIEQFIHRENHIKQGYYISWSNCAKQAAKALRRFYKRPYFLPSSVETFEKNFIFFSKHYKGRDRVEFRTEPAIIILQQIKGSSKVHLTPEQFCNKTCVPLEDSLHEGEVLIAMNTHRVWTLEIQGTDNEENIAIGIEGNYN